MNRSATLLAAMLLTICAKAPAQSSWPAEIKAAEMKAVLSSAGKAPDWLKKALDGASKEKNWTDAYNELTPDDEGYEPNYTPPGMPELPVQCDRAGTANSGPDGDAETAAALEGWVQQCGECFQHAYQQLSDVRVRFEKLRRVYQSTTNFIKKSLAFGDSASGIHGLTGLAWQTERRKIEQSANRLNASYDAKYAELVAALMTALQDISKCESDYFNEDWYNRFGFVYYTFMADRYRRDTGAY